MRNILARDRARTLARFVRGRVLLAFDYDGTLAPIVRDPERAALRARTRACLGRLAALYPCVVISGRARADVAGRLEGLGVAAVIGNHGLEAGRTGRRFRRLVARWRRALAGALAGLPGVVLEDKGLSLAIHYRAAPDRARSRQAVMRAVTGLPGARVFGGKAVVNLTPEHGPHKGTALEREMARRRCDRAVYVGDDQTDEDVFALERQERLLTIRVGPHLASRAAYCLRDQRQVDALLSRLAALRAEGGQASPPAGGGQPRPAARRRARGGAASASKKGASTARAAVSRTR